MELDTGQAYKIRQLAEQRRISLLLLFGSAVTGVQHPRSDLDIAVLFQEYRDLPYAEYSDLVQELQEIFPGQSLDINMINHVDPLFLKKITENCQILYGSSRRLHELKIYAFKRYQDHRRYFDMEQRYVKQFLKKGKVTHD